MRTINKLILASLLALFIGTNASAQQPLSNIVDVELKTITTKTTQEQLNNIVDKLVKMYPGNEGVHAAIYLRIKEIIQAFKTSELQIGAVAIAFKKALNLDNINHLIERANKLKNPVDARNTIKTNDASSPST